jgi:lysophospholipase L1-like esterase
MQIRPIVPLTLFTLALLPTAACDEPIDENAILADDVDDPADDLADDPAALDELAAPARETAAGYPCRILPLGDSITYGWNSNPYQAADINYGGGYRAHLAWDFATAPSASVGPILMVGKRTANSNPLLTSWWQHHHSGYEGLTIAELRAKVQDNPYKTDDAVADFDPDVILLHIGTNNMLRSPYPQSTYALTELSLLLNELDARVPDATILLAKILPLVGPYAVYNAEVNKFNAALDGVALSRRGLGQDIWTVDQNSYFPTWTLLDGIHPDFAGYDHMAARWRLALDAVGCGP